MKFKNCLKWKVAIPKFVVIVFFCVFALSFCFADVGRADDWETCDCSSGGSPQTWIFTGDMPCDISFVWCPNCEPDIAGYMIEYKIIDNEPTGIIGPDDENNMWPGVGINEGDSPIMMWNPGKKPTGTEYTNDLTLVDGQKPEVRLTGLIPGKYYLFALRAVDTEGFKSSHSDENSGFTVCGPGAPLDLIIKF